MSQLQIPAQDEMMVVAAARMLTSTTVCFVGIGLPSAAAVLAQQTHAPGLYMVYESGALGPRPGAVPLSVADHRLAQTAQTIVSVAEMFNYWLQPGRIGLGLLGTAQIDRFGNLNSTTIGAYDSPKVRLPGAGGAPEIVAACGEIVIMVRQSRRTLVENLDFVTSLGHGTGQGERAAAGLRGRGPRAVVTDMGVYAVDPERGLVLTELHPGVREEDARATAGWDLAVASHVGRTEPPDRQERDAVRRLNEPGEE